MGHNSLHLQSSVHLVIVIIDFEPHELATLSNPVTTFIQSSWEAARGA